jgi:hypothetical protein
LPKNGAAAEEAHDLKKYWGQSLLHFTLIYMYNNICTSSQSNLCFNICYDIRSRCILRRRYTHPAS